MDNIFLIIVNFWKVIPIASGQIKDSLFEN